MVNIINLENEEMEFGDMCILEVIERQIDRLQEVSEEVDYSNMIASEALDTEIKVSEEIRNLIDIYSKLSKNIDKNENKYKDTRLKITNEFEEIKNNYIKIRKKQEEKRKFDSMSFGEKINFYMEEVQMTLEELSCHLELDKTMINFLLGKTTPNKLSLEYVYRLAKALKLDKAEIGDLVMSCKG